MDQDMAKPAFLYNLRPETYTPTVSQNLSPKGYLLSPAYATRKAKELAQQVRFQEYRLMADNGNFSHIEKLRAQFEATAQSLFLEVAKAEHQLGRSLRASDAFDSLRNKYRALAKDVQNAAKQLAGNGEENLQVQIELNPTSLIGVEDITLAAWLSLNIEPVYLDFPSATYRALNRSVAKRAVKRQKQLPEALAQEYYPVASASSYNTAFDVGSEFARKGLEKISMGFGAFMADDNWTDHVQIGTRTIVFKERFPNRYIRTAAVAKGFWDGYMHQAGRPPKAFHFLGLGALIMLPLVTLAAWETPDLTFDATSPIKDALQGGTLYVTKPAYLKLRTQSIAYRLASDPTAEWNCPCPFCREFIANHPFQRELGFKWLKQTGAREVSSQDLRAKGALFSAFPLLSEPGAGPLRKAVNQARIGHNHWVLEEIMTDLGTATDRQDFQARVEGILKRYEENTKADRYGRAIRFAYNLITSLEE